MGRCRPPLLELDVAEPPSGGRGTHPPWGKSRTRRRTQRRARQLTSQAERAASRYVVLRPSFHPSAHQRAVGRNLALDLVAAVGVGVSMALVTTLLPTMARRSGLEPIGLAALAAAPFVANLLGAFAGRVGPRSQRQLAIIRGAGSASLLVLAVLAVAPILVAVSIAYLAQPVARRPVPPPAMGLDVPGARPGSGRRVHRLGTCGRGRRRGARRRDPGRPVRWRDGGGAGRSCRSRVRPRLRRPAGPERRAPGDVLGPRVPPGVA